MLKSNDLTSQLLPTIVTARGVLAMLITSQILACVLAFAPLSYESVWVRLGIFSLFIHCVSAVGFSTLYCLRNKVSRYGFVSQVMLTLVIFQCITMLISVVVSYYSALYDGIFDWTFVLKNMAICLFVSLFFIHSMTIFLDKLQTVETLSKVEFEALSARIRPHFLYNSLNTIAELAHCNADDAEQAVLTLAQLCKATMRAQQLALLSDELQLAKQYLALERWRFGERLTVNWFVPESIPRIQLPVLTVQPLLENAVIYGVEPAAQATQIDVGLHIEKQYVVLTIKNGYNRTRKATHQGQGIAQNNIRARLAHHFGERASLEIEQGEHVYTVTLCVPLDHLS
ncbi:MULTISPECIES: sensor histidine kinase [Pseudoalteromonas]|uniref:Signal transduction histidine kinase internal region domain-containing protein n=1 Tax=Pseudoalteromonas amylolytica TaxID=1859457 RepID=A0A1S1MR70_9GAMM|nr:MULTISPECIES: histidine kinase [Pseudoalteromonas]OHU86760.1 hypothetical protein BFC16_14790 [Pseudoalteromonas sp. JW3]OHU88715.1 hypothetical protein BET10_17965 [Pseudoalteromonas amylolytica]